MVQSKLTQVRHPIVQGSSILSYGHISTETNHPVPFLTFAIKLLLRLAFRRSSMQTTPPYHNHLKTAGWISELSIS